MFKIVVITRLVDSWRREGHLGSLPFFAQGVLSERGGTSEEEAQEGGEDLERDEQPQHLERTRVVQQKRRKLHCDETKELEEEERDTRCEGFG